MAVCLPLAVGIAGVVQPVVKSGETGSLIGGDGRGVVRMSGSEGPRATGIGGVRTAGDSRPKLVEPDIRLSPV